MKGTIGQAQGKVFQIPASFTGRETPCVPIYHPAALLRSRSPERYRDMERKIRWALQTALFELEHGSDTIPHYDPYVPSDTRTGILTMAPGYAVDTETTGKDLDSTLLLISAYNWSGDGCDDLMVWHPETPLEIPDGTIFWNALFDLPVLAKHGSKLPRLADDGMVVAWMKGEDRLGLKWNSQKHDGTRVMTYEEMMRTGGWDVATNYSAQDAVITHRRFHATLPTLSPDERHWYDTIARPLLPILAQASVHGFEVDHEGLLSLLKDLWVRRAQLLESVRSYGGPEFNPASPQQVGYLLFHTLGLRSVHKTKAGADSTDETTLIALSQQHPVCSLLLGWRTADKLIGTYIRSLLESPTAHTYYQLTGTETGRLSSSTRNLTNLPKKIKGYLRAPEGYTFVIADYDQIELKVAACLSGDAAMLEDIRNGVSLHDRLCLAVYGRIEPILRTRAKSANFERLYGGGIRKMAKVLQVSEGQAAAVGDLWPGFDAYAHRVGAQAARDGYSETAFGRRRKLFDLWSTSDYLQKKAGREAINTPIQGSVADMVNLAITRIHPLAQQLGGWFSHQEHDSILVTVPERAAEEATTMVLDCMTNAAPDIFRQVPITASVKVSPCWI
jgi:DNA polymerase-1